MRNSLPFPIPLTERQNRILELLSVKGVASLEFLAEQIGKSISTIRRDISYLAAQQLVTPLRGGVAIAHTYPVFPLNEIELPDYWEEKKRIGKAAARLVSDGQVIAINAGTTAMALASYLLDHKNLIIVTADIEIAQLLASNPSFEVYLLGGQLQFEVPGIVGSFALEMLKAFYYQTGFIGVRAISLKEGLMTRTIDQAACSQAILNQSHKKVVIADSSKFYRQAGAKIATLSEIDVLITDRGLEQNPDLMEQICAFPNLELIIV